jgi:hypothetical protein
VLEKNCSSMQTVSQYGPLIFGLISSLFFTSLRPRSIQMRRKCTPKPVADGTFHKGNLYFVLKSAGSVTATSASSKGSKIATIALYL